MLKYNTLYQSLKKVSGEWHAGHVEWQYCWNYLKFYKDGTVIYASSTGVPTQMEWFDINNKEAFFYRGSFEFEKQLYLRIKIPVSFGTLCIDGAIIKSNQLILRSTNKEMKLIENWDEYLIPNVSI